MPTHAATSATPATPATPNSSGSIGHVAIYAGNGRMGDAPKSGDHVRLRAIYSSHYSVGRP